MSTSFFWRSFRHISDLCLRSSRVSSCFGTCFLTFWNLWAQNHSNRLSEQLYCHKVDQAVAASRARTLWLYSLRLNTAAWWIRTDSALTSYGSFGFCFWNWDRSISMQLNSASDTLSWIIRFDPGTSWPLSTRTEAIACFKTHKAFQAPASDSPNRFHRSS